MNYVPISYLKEHHKYLTLPYMHGIIGGLNQTMRGGAVAARRAQPQEEHLQLNTKHKGDIAEQAAILEALKRGWGVLRPIGDNLPYDLIFDVSGNLIKIQVKCAWFDESSGNFVVDNRRTKTNRRVMVRDEYSESDFDFALVYIPECNLFYIFPVEVFISYGSEIHMVETDKRQRKPKSIGFRDAWSLLLQRAANRVTYS